MRKIGILDGPEGEFFKIAEKKLKNTSIVLENFRGGQRFDAVLITEDAINGSVECEKTVLPGVGTPVRVRSGCAISYGTSPRDTLTISSMGDKGMLLAIQRDIKRLDNITVPQQEIFLDWKLSAHRALPIAAIFILCGEMGVQ